MAIFNGKDLTIKIGDGEQNEIFSEIEGILDSNIKFQNQAINDNNIVSKDWQINNALLGSKLITINISGIYHDSIASDALRSSAFLGKSTNYQIYFGSGDKIIGEFIVTDYERSGKEKSEEYFKANLVSNDKIDYIIS